jgi:hypothetical protein
VKVTYKESAEAQPRVWNFDPDEVPQSQAEIIEKRYGQLWDQFLADVRQGSAKARRVLLWHLLRLEHHTLRFEDTPDFKMGAVKVEHSVEELLRVRDRVAKANLDPEEKDGILAALDVEITEQMGDAPAPEPEPELKPGKASKTSA